MPLVCGYNIPINCNICYEMSIIEPCNNSIINLQVNLISKNQYYLWVIDKFNNIWRDIVIVKIDGSIDLIIANYPIRLFNKNTGIFRIFLSNDISGADIIDLKINTIIYLCIILNFI